MFVCFSLVFAIEYMCVDAGTRTTEHVSGALAVHVKTAAHKNAVKSTHLWARCRFSKAKMREYSFGSHSLEYQGDERKDLRPL